MSLEQRADHPTTDINNKAPAQVSPETEDQNLQTADETLESTDDTLSVEAPSVETVRDAVIPDRKKSILEKLDTPVKKFMAFLAISGAVAAGAIATEKGVEGIAANKVVGQQADQNHHDIAGTQAPTATNGNTLASSSPSPSSIESLKPAQDSGELGTFTADAMKIPAGLSDEQFGKTLIDRLNTWFTAGATKENYDRWWATNAPDTALEGFASDNTFIGAKALFGPDWQKNAQISEQVKGIEAIDSGFMRMWFMSLEQKLSVGPVITESVEYTGTELLSSTSTGRTVNVTGIVHTNANKSSLGKTFPKVGASDGTEFRVNVTTKIDKATGIEYIDTYATY